MGKSKRVPLVEAAGDINSLGEALRSAGLKLEGGEAQKVESPSESSVPSGPSREGTPKSKAKPRSASLSIRRKGLGGHQCTAVLVKGLSAEELGGLCKSLKTALGCGARVEEGEVLVQGDQRERLKAVLSRMGFRVTGG
ncbi:translation initiation factor eIF-1/SUI1-like protein [Thermanaerovibrio velox DSM 12556]|uniref:Translation initiation factor eIF-1/SUI1-like protein n=1 Tax=Thermanaerovibrio velox DSM 12556 TaxID=926567 RepID=H0UMY9_9BACT|nr:translation initiation factor [Thermanaerovibrio velox]EHM09268.1 translation initiation factor eIF-1/SUI1-like protein [Thermanaerovibrio velox DSM 12556]